MTKSNLGKEGLIWLTAEGSQGKTLGSGNETETRESGKETLPPQFAQPALL